MISTQNPFPQSSLRLRAEGCLKRNRNNHNSDKLTAETLQLLHELQVHQIELELQNLELQESRTRVEIGLAHYTDLYDHAVAGYFTFDHEGIIIQTNLMGASLLRMERSQVLGKHFVSFLAVDDCFVFNDLLKKVFRSEQRQSCEVKLSKNGECFMVIQIEATLFKGQECRGIVQDITDRVEKEKWAQKHQMELEQVARINSMGELASSIAQKLNHPLTVVINYVNGCVRDLESNNYEASEVLEAMRVAAKQIELVGDIMQHMKKVVRQHESSYKLISINEVAEVAVSQIQKEPDYDVTVPLILELENELPLVSGDHIQIELVILNLLRYSLEAVHKAKVAKPKLILRTERQNSMIIVSVINNGPHYSEEDERQLFEPSFTTKKEGLGMLSISRTIVEAHSGRLSSYKLSTFGVCFQFTLPVNQ